MIYSTYSSKTINIITLPNNWMTVLYIILLVESSIIHIAWVLPIRGKSWKNDQCALLTPGPTEGNPRSWVMLRCCDFSKLNGPIVPSDQITQFKDGLPNLPHSSMGMGVENVITFIIMMHLLILYTGWSNSSSSKNIMGPWKQGIR